MSLDQRRARHHRYPMTPPSTARNRSNTQAELSVVLDAAACTTSADASPSAEPVAPVGPVGPVTARSPGGSPGRSRGGLALGSGGRLGDGVSVGDGCSVGGGCSPSRSRMAMIARISRPCPGGGPSVGSAGDSVDGSVGSSVGVSTGPVGPVGAVGSPDSVGPVGAVGSPDSPPVGPVGRGLGSTLGSPLTPLGSASRISSRDSSVHAVASRPSITKRTTTLRRPVLRTLTSTRM